MASKTQLPVSTGGDVIVCIKGRLAADVPKSLPVGPRSQHAVGGIPYWGHTLKGALPSWSSQRKVWRLGSSGERIYS